MSDSLIADPGDSTGAETKIAATSAAATAPKVVATDASAQVVKAIDSGVKQPWFSSWLKADGTLDHAAFDSAPDDVKASKGILGKYKTVEEMAHGITHLASLVGKKGLMPLPETATDQDRAEFRSRLNEILGVPKEPAGYGIKRPDSVPENEWDEASVNEFSALAHKMGLPPDAAKAIVEFDIKRSEAAKGVSAKAEADYRKTQVDMLTKAWEGQDVAKNKQRISILAKNIGLDPKDPLFSEARFVLSLEKVANLIGEDKLVDGSGNGGPGAGSAEAEKTAILNDKSNPLYEAYRNGGHVRHLEAVRKISALNELISRQKDQRR